MLYLTCSTITSVDLALYRVSRAKYWVSVDCGTSCLGVNNDPSFHCLHRFCCIITVMADLFLCSVMVYHNLQNIRKSMLLGRFTFSHSFASF